MRTVHSLSAAILVLAAFAVSPTSADTTPKSGAAASARAGSTARPVLKQVLPWIEDDWTRAVALAKQRKLPIFVESWAPW